MYIKVDVNLIYVVLLAHLKIPLVSGSRLFKPAYSCGINTCSGDRINQSCSCDDACPFYGDCCSDYTGEVGGHLTLKKTIECYKTNLAGSYLLATRCPAEWEDRFVLESCESKFYGLSKEYQMPVISSQSKYSYKNMFCAHCNGELLRNLKYWSFVHSCASVFDNPTFIDVFEQYANKKCKIVCDEPTMRPCLRETRPCDGELAVNTLELTVQMCNSYVDPVFIHNGPNEISFKNVYCIICNKLKTTTAKCEDVKFNTRFTGLSDLTKFTTSPSKSASKSDSKIAHIELERSIVCLGKSVFYLNACRNIQCPSGFFVIERICEPRLVPIVVVCRINSRDQSQVYNTIKKGPNYYTKLKIKYGVCQTKHEVKGFLLRSPRDRYAMIALLQTFLHLAGQNFRSMRTHVFSNSHINSHVFRTCKYFSFVGNVSINNQNLLNLITNFQDDVPWPWYVNLTNYKPANTSEYALDGSVCHMKSLCRMVLIDSLKVPKYVLGGSWKTWGTKRYVCVDKIRIYYAQIIAERNNQLQEFFNKLKEARKVSRTPGFNCSGILLLDSIWYAILSIMVFTGMASLLFI